MHDDDDDDAKHWFNFHRQPNYVFECTGSQLQIAEMCIGMYICPCESVGCLFGFELNNFPHNQ